MSRRKRRAREPRAARREAPGRSSGAGAGRPRTRRWLVPSIGAVISLSLALVWWATRALTGSPRDFPPPPPPPPAAAAAFEDFLGAEQCASCHRSQYDAWRRSTHGRAGGVPASVELVAPFDGRPMRFADAVVVPRRGTGGRHEFVVSRPGLADSAIAVDGVIGGGHLVGGGTQGYVTRYPDGTMRFLPFDFSRSAGSWFCNTAGRADVGWVPIGPALRLIDCADWPPFRVVGSHDRFVNCQQCHGSQILLAFDPSELRYATRFTSLQVNCESCHGPGRRHVELVRAGAHLDSPDIGMRPLAVTETDASLEVCFQCHALKEELAPGYLPGRPFATHFSTKLATLGTAPFFPDGRVRTFAYQQNHLASGCYVSGSMTCTDCHEPHGQTYRDVAGRPLPGRLDDGQCLGCHPSKSPPTDHTNHAPGSPGSRCVACHMPYLQQPTVGDRIPYARSDHTIPIPRPGFDAALGVESACWQCHRNLEPAELDEQVRAWYGETKPHPPAVRGLLDARRLRDAERAAPLVLRPDEPAAFAQFAGLSHYFVQYLGPEMPALPGGVADRLAQLARSPDDDVAALALASLHLARGDDPATRAVLVGALETLGEREMPIRRRWAAALERRASGYRVSGEAAQALTTYRKALEVAPHDPALHRDLGVALLDGQRADEALRHLGRSLELDAAQPLALVNLAFALTLQGQTEAAMEAYRRAEAINPSEPLIYLSKGNALLRRGALQEAARAFQRAVAADPGLAEAYFGLGAVYARLDHRADAAAALRRGLALEPENAGARQLLEQLAR